MSREFEIRKEVVLDATPEQVWEAISTGAGNAAWFMTIDDVDPDAAHVQVYDAPKHLKVDAGTQAFEYLVEARDGGTATLRFVHSGVLDDDWASEYEDMTSRGWDLYFHTLAEYFRHFAGRSAVYVEAEGPKVPNDTVRALLYKELGLPEAPSPGDPVRLTLDGADAQGELDYAGPAHFGIRTADSLIRFHLRASLGMPVAVGHHRYGTETDAARLTHAWEGWLNRVLG